MSQHLSCKPLDLDKICQNLVQKFVERNMVAEALFKTKGMLVRLHKHRLDAVGGGSKGRKYGISNQNKENKPKSVPDADAWKEAMEELLRAPQDANSKFDTDECALVLGCLSTLAALSNSDVPLDSVCGKGCLLWAKELAHVDENMAARLCSNMYKASSKAAAAEDARAKTVQPGSVGHFAVCNSAITIRQYSVCVCDARDLVEFQMSDKCAHF